LKGSSVGFIIDVLRYVKSSIDLIFGWDVLGREVSQEISYVRKAKSGSHYVMSCLNPLGIIT
jgi:hypothetical protein